MFQINMLLQFDNAENSIERVLWFSVEDDLLILVNIFDRNLPTINSLSCIEKFIEDDKIKITQNDPYIIIDLEKYSEKDIINRDKVWERIKNISSNEPSIYYKNERRKIIIGSLIDSTYKESTIYNHLKKYWKRGLTVNALLPNRNSNMIRRQSKGFEINDKVEKIFFSTLEKHYYSKRGNTITNAYHLMIKDYFSTISFDEKNQDHINVSDEIPSLRQFRYYFEKVRDRKKEIITRKGSINYMLNSRGITGSTLDGVYGNGYYEIDATVFDLYVVSGYDHKKIIGRPVLYFCMDSFSRVIVGYNIGMNSPSWEEASLCLYNAFTSKVQICESFGIKISDKEWPFGIPHSILADKGEFEGYLPNNLVKGLNIKLLNTSSKRGDMKGIIEKSFDVLQSNYLKPFLDGFVDPKRKTRQTIDYRKNANITLKQLNEIVLKYIIFHNNNHFLKTYERDLEMINDNIPRVPNKLWEYGLKRFGKLRHIDENILKLNLLSHSKALITSKGIKFLNLYYTSQRSIKEEWFSKARMNGSKKISIVYDSRNMQYIYIRDEGGRSYEKCSLVTHHELYSGLSHFEVKEIIKNESKDVKEYEKEEIQKKVELFSDIEKIANDAKKKSKYNLFAQSDSSRIGDIKINKEIEKTLINKERFIEIDVSEESEGGEIIDINKNSIISYSNDEKLLRDQLKKRLKNHD